MLKMVLALVLLVVEKRPNAKDHASASSGQTGCNRNEDIQKENRAISTTGTIIDKTTRDQVITSKY